MGLNDTFAPFRFDFLVQQGAHFHLELPTFSDAVTGQPFDFTADPAGTWRATLDMRSRGGGLVAAFSSDGTKDGLVTLRSDGSVALDLDSSFTTGLEATVSSEYQPNGQAPLFADLVLIDPLDSEPWVFYAGKGQIRKQVTD